MHSPNLPWRSQLKGSPWPSVEDIGDSGPWLLSNFPPVFCKGLGVSEGQMGQVRPCPDGAFRRVALGEVPLLGALISYAIAEIQVLILPWGDQETWELWGVRMGSG